MGGTLGDFRIVREVGRGGMGVVYEAEQLSLRRRVALKVLPFAATMDPRHLQRFHNEAQAAACLHHANIVPVYFVGSERGVHFYAMQFIEGQSLAELIAAQRNDAPSGGRQPPEWTLRELTPPARGPDTLTQPIAAATTQAAPRDAAHSRRIAEWGIQAAEALEHAHSLGIVHRDIKPANLMIDGAGKLWVTDFGLARTATDAGLTMTNDVLGTLRYMSPEQALAKHGLVDHRSDIYSLGATLYEMLTLRPAVDGKDREAILGKIAFEEPPSPRSLDRAIPADLETIVLKAIAKEPAERYATAQELADDLRRFLDDRPIRARRPPWLHRVRKWSQRHRHLLQMFVAFLVLMVVGLAVSAYLIWCEGERTRTALAEARSHYARAEDQRQRAEFSCQNACWAIEDILCAFDPARSARPVNVAEVNQWQTARALQFLAVLCQDPSEDPSNRFMKAGAWVHTGRVHQVRGERGQARQAFQKAAAVYRELIQDFPECPDYPPTLATVLRIMAEDYYEAGEMAEANLYCRQAMDTWSGCLRKHPTDAGSCRELANLLSNWFDLQLRDPVAALDYARRGVNGIPNEPRSYLTLGLAYYRNGRWDAALEALQKSLQWPEVLGKWGWTHALQYLAMTHWQLGQREEAFRAFRQAEERMKKTFRTRDVLDRAIRNEAAALLGIKEPPPFKVEEKQQGHS
jgi:serine/threonine protein kinase